jgi:predicted pyridoxine 5'-phosphate oxidase superfamily flavin-nucleotide-binding protein
MTDRISTIAALEEIVGTAPLGVKMKIIDHLDRGAADWIARAPIAFVGFATADGPRVCLAGGQGGFAEVRGGSRLFIPASALDASDAAKPGFGAGVLFLVPGIGETLRTNGRVVTADTDGVEIEIDEVFFHCAKALIRSSFWEAKAADAPDDAEALLNASRFLAIATMGTDGRIEISPKGDPAGLLLRAFNGAATIAERPGNRLAFGYRNIVVQPRVAAVVLVPGSDSVVTLTGKAHLSTSEDVRAAFEVGGKRPILATVIEGISAEVRESAALKNAAVWTTKQPKAELDPSALLVAHLKLNKTKGDQAMALRTAANRLVVAKGLEASYKHSLY